eukprot:4284676-Pyramimonas_sp.AAC.1
MRSGCADHSTSPWAICRVAGTPRPDGEEGAPCEQQRRNGHGEDPVQDPAGRPPSDGNAAHTL